MAPRTPLRSRMIFWAVSWLFQKSGAFIFSSSSLMRACLAGTSKRVADGFHPRLEIGDEGFEIFAGHDGSFGGRKRWGSIAALGGRFKRDGLVMSMRGQVRCRWCFGAR